MLNIRKYRKLPVTIQAVFLTLDNMKEVAKWVNTKQSNLATVGAARLAINTPEGNMMAIPGTDWVIQGVNGEFYPCKDDIFKKTYEVA
jgi:hypothetical protein